MKEKVKLAIIWANPYNKNMGVAALAYSTLAFISDILQKKNIKHEIFVVGSSEKGKRFLILNDHEIEFDNLHVMNYLNWKSLLKLTLLPFRYKTFKLLKFDYVLDIAAGDSFSDIYSQERFNLILNSKRFYHLLGVKQILMPQTIGPFQNPKNEKKAFKVMRKLAAVISRDKQSYEYTSKFLSKDKIYETIDIAFYLPYVKKDLGNEKINVGINVSGLLWHLGYKEKNQFSLRCDYRELTHKIIDYFENKENVQVHVIPHVVPNNKHIEDDCMVSEILKEEYPSLIISPYFNDPIEAKSYISGMDFFIGARMHSCIAAFSTGVPVFPMAYSRKFNGLFTETLNYPVLGDCVNQTEDEIFSNLKKAFNDKKQLQQQISLANNTVVKERLKLLEKIILKTIKL